MSVNSTVDPVKLLPPYPENGWKTLSGRRNAGLTIRRAIRTERSAKCVRTGRSVWHQIPLTTLGEGSNGNPAVHAATDPMDSCRLEWFPVFQSSKARATPTPARLAINPANSAKRALLHLPWRTASESAQQNLSIDRNPDIGTRVAGEWNWSAPPKRFSNAGPAIPLIFFNLPDGGPVQQRHDPLLTLDIRFKNAICASASRYVARSISEAGSRRTSPDPPPPPLLCSPAQACASEAKTADAPPKA